MTKRYNWIRGVCGLILLGCLAPPLPAAPAQHGGLANPNDFDLTPTIVERGANHRVWQTRHLKTNEIGEVEVATGSFVELATGMHYIDDQGQWAETQEKIDIVPFGAAAQNGAHTVAFSDNITTAGAFTIRTPEGKTLRGGVLGLAYFDTSTGKSVLIAEVKASQGELLPPNKVIYRNAFTDFKADIRYSYSKGGVDQIVTLREQPPSPSEFGLNPDTTILEVLTEFLDQPAPQAFPRVLASAEADLGNPSAVEGYTDEKLEFGSMQMGLGRAFEAQGPVGDSMGLAQDLKAIVRKRWRQLDGRDFLIESVEYPAVKPSLDKLPLPPQANNSRNSRKQAAVGISLPARKVARAGSLPMQIAALSSEADGLVIDFTLLNTANNFTFRSDTTYYVSGSVVLSGTTTIEGGTVIKFASTNGPTIQCDTNILCLTGQYHIAAFTGIDDNTLGEIITGSTGIPTNTYANYALYFPNGTTNALHHMRFSRAGTSIYALYRCGRISDVQIDNSSGGFVQAYGTITNSVHNVLIRNVTTPFFSYQSSYEVEHATLDQCYYLSDDLGSSDPFNITNSILANITSLGGYSSLNANYNGLYNCPAMSQSTGFTNASTPFRVVGGGSYYLATNCAWTNVGTLNVNATLATELKSRTTHSPVLITGVTRSMTLAPLPIREVNTLGLGYHYDPLDYAFGGAYLVTCSTIIATNGVAIGIYVPAGGNTYGLCLTNGGSLFDSEGTPINPNRIVVFNVAQENSTTNWGLNLTGSILNQSSGVGKSEVYARFTDWVMLSGSAGPAHYVGYTGTNSVPTVFRDSQFLRGGVSTTGASILVTNCLFDGVGISIRSSTNSQTFFNDNIRGGTLLLSTNSGGTWTFRDCLFDQTVITQTNSTLVASNNAYLTNYSRLSPNGSNDVVLTNASVPYSVGPLGRFYQATNSLLINAGSRTADLVGLFHHTTQTNQVPETNSVVDIGFHYIALGTNGLPLNLDGSGVADYIEDFNGNGIWDAGELNWQNPDNAYTGNGDTHPYSPITLGHWKFDTTNWFGEAGQVPTMVSNVQSVASWSSNAVHIDSILSSNLMINLDFAGANPSTKVGFAAYGVATNDFWNTFYAPLGVNTVTNLLWTDSTASGAGVTVTAGTGAYGFTHPDPMYAVYDYLTGGSITVTVTNLLAGEYDIVLYGHGNANIYSSIFTVSCAGINYGTNSTTTGSGYLSTNWTEGQQYVVFRTVAVPAASPVTITALVSSGYGLINGMQLIHRKVSRLAYNDVETNGTSNITLDHGTVSLWYQPAWSGTNAGGQGPGLNSRLIEMGQKSAVTTNCWWGLYLTPDGTQLKFSAQTNGVETNFFTAPVTWVSNVWHNVVVAYTATNSVLYVNGVVVTNGKGVTCYPSFPVRHATGFSVGSDNLGLNQANGNIEELTTYNYALTAAQVATAMTNTLGSLFGIDTDYDGRSDGQEILDGTDPANANSVLPVQLSYWRFDTTNFLGDNGQIPIALTNVGVMPSWDTNALSINSVPSGSLPLINIDFGGAVQTTTVKGIEAIGNTTNDVWNLYASNGGSGGLVNLSNYDGSVSSVGLNVAGVGGAWGIGSTDPMYDGYLYASASMTFTFTNLSAGVYDLYFYGHGNAAAYNSVVSVTCGNVNYGTNSTGTGAGYNSTNWVEGNQYIAFRSITVPAGSSPMTITVFTDGSGYSIINGMQLIRQKTARLAYKDIEGTNGPNINLRNGAVVFWFKPNWSSTTAGGTGPKCNARLLESGQWTTNAATGWWSLYTDPSGTNLIFAGQLSNVFTTNLTGTISWTSNQWHAITLTYSPTNSQLYIDWAAYTLNGGGVSNYPNATERAITGFSIGSDSQGNNQANGQFEDMITHNYQHFYGEVSSHYQQTTINRPKVKAMMNASAFASGALYGGSVANNSTNSPNVQTIATVPALSLSIYGTNTTFIIGMSGNNTNTGYTIYGTTNIVGTFLPIATNAANVSTFTVVTNTSAMYFQVGWSFDSDGDGLSDSYEHYVSKTEPQNPDSDYDGNSDGQEVANGTNPLDATSFASVMLGHWGFDSTGWTGALAQPLTNTTDTPLSFLNIQNVSSWSGNALYVGSPNPAYLKYDDVFITRTSTNANGNAYPIINLARGTVSLWFRPTWSSTSAGGSGAGSSAYLMESGSQPDGQDWWSWYFSANGNQLLFSAQTNGVSTNYLTANVSLASNVWHNLVLTYTNNSSTLYIDGASVTNGSGAVFYPSMTNRVNYGVGIGSDHAGANQAYGKIDELETFNYQLSSGTISTYYQGLTNIVTTGNGLSPAGFHVFITQPATDSILP